MPVPPRRLDGLSSFYHNQIMIIDLLPTFLPYQASSLMRSITEERRVDNFIVIVHGSINPRGKRELIIGKNMQLYRTIIKAMLKMLTSSEANTFSLDQYLNIQTKIYSRVQNAILICVLETKGNRCVTIPIHPPFSICTTRLIYYVATVDK